MKSQKTTQNAKQSNTTTTTDELTIFNDKKHSAAHHIMANNPMLPDDGDLTTSVKKEGQTLAHAMAKNVK